MENGGIPTAESYGQYKAMEGRCHINDPERAKHIILEAKITHLLQISNDNFAESVIAIKMAIQTKGPVVALMYATEHFNQYYTNNPHEVFHDPIWYEHEIFGLKYVIYQWIFFSIQ